MDAHGCSIPPKEAIELIDKLVLPLRTLPQSEFEGMPVGSADFAFAAAIQLLGWWQTELAQALRVVHDKTANMARQQAVWDALASADMLPFVQKTASGLTLTYPVGIVETVFGSSEAHSGLQLAHILAGAIGSCLGPHSGKDDAGYARDVLERMEFIPIHAQIPPTHISPRAMNTLGLDSDPGHRYFAEQFASGKAPNPQGRDKTTSQRR